MKKMNSIVLWIICVLVSSNSLLAAPIPVDIISSNFHIEGYASGILYPQNTPLYDSYNQSSTNPISRNINFTPPLPYGLYASSDTGYFSVGASAYAFMDISYAEAEAEWVFKPVYDFNNLTINLHFDHASSMYLGIKGELIDLTDNILLWNIDKPLWQSWELPWEPINSIISHYFESDHLYRLYFMGASSANMDYGSINFRTNDIIPAPEPSSLLLLGSGLVVLVGYGRTRTKK